MTAQINDVFQYQGDSYCIAGISEGELFDPSVLELKPVGTCSACWRGYLADFGVVDQHVALINLHTQLCTDDEEMRPIQGPVINGISPKPKDDEDDWFNNHYLDINFHLEYSGGLLIADRFIKELYVHMGFHPAWKYETVHELIFANGVLTAAHNRSEQMAEIRDRFLSDDLPTHEPPSRDIHKFVEDAFDRSYPMGRF